MGMFDYIKCAYPLPDLPEWADPMDGNWQTKDTPSQMLDLYTVTEEGALNLSETYSWDDEERKTVKPADIPFDGDIFIYTAHDSRDEWLEYRLTFRKGRVTEVEKIVERDLFAELTESIKQAGKIKRGEE